jgi:hypothetical protein
MKWDAPKTRALVTNVTSGMTDNVELANVLNISTHQVYNKRKALGLTKNNRPIHDPVDELRGKAAWTREEDELLMKFHNEGKKPREIAKHFYRSVCAVENRRSKIVREGEMSNLTLFDEDKMPKETTPEPLVQGKYTKYLEPQTEVSILWGLVKYKKA